MILAVHTVSTKLNFRYVGGEGKEDEIIVWFRVRKWACEEEKKKNEARFWYLRAFGSSTFYISYICDSSILNVILCLGFKNRFNIQLDKMN